MAARGGLTVYVNFCCWLLGDIGAAEPQRPLSARKPT